MIAPSIVIVDIDSGTPLDERIKVAAALNIQVIGHFCPAWGQLGTVRAETPTTLAKPGEWRLELRKMPTQADALGFHDRSDEGTPLLYVFPPLCKQLGTSWSSCASHEILEALCDPGCHRCAQLPDGRIVAVEPCDAVEADTYTIDGIEVSNFVLPAAFEPAKDGRGPFDYLNLTTEPFEVRRGGYSQVFMPGKGWEQITARQSLYGQAMTLLGLGRFAKRAA